MTDRPAGATHARDVVAFHYTLRDSAGVVLGTSGPVPLRVAPGAHEVVPGLERALTGRKAGDKFDVVVPPGEGYGERVDEELMRTPRVEFPQGYELAPGMPIALEDDRGMPHPVWIMDVTKDEVVLSLNHPLAGVTLHFEVHVVDVHAPQRAAR